jgi:hypothetical protein
MQSLYLIPTRKLISRLNPGLEINASSQLIAPTVILQRSAAIG